MTITKTSGGKFVVKSEKTGRNLSKPTTKASAQKRLAQVEFFKHHPEAAGGRKK
jgi:hypothetical protein